MLDKLSGVFRLFWWWFSRHYKPQHATKTWSKWVATSWESLETSLQEIPGPGEVVYACLCVCVCMCVMLLHTCACASLLQQRIFLRKIHIVCLEEGQLWKLYNQCSNAILMLCVFFSAPWYSSSCFIPSTTCAVPTLVACCCQHISSLSTCSQRSS